MKMTKDFGNYLGKAFPGTPPAEALERAEPETRAAIEHAYAVRVNFGLWDECDPIAAAIVELTAAQNVVTAAINEEVYFETSASIHAAAVNRVTKIIELLEALIDETVAPSGGAKIDRATRIELVTLMTDAVKRLGVVAAEQQY
jgi:hypothetical protein